MTILSQGNFKGEYQRPGRTYKKKPRYRIKKTPEGYVWVSKKKKPLTKPTRTRSETRKLIKLKLKQIKSRRK